MRSNLFQHDNFYIAICVFIVEQFNINFIRSISQLYNNSNVCVVAVAHSWRIRIHLE